MLDSLPSTFEEIDYKRIFAPTCSLVTLRTMCSISNHMDYELVNFDFTAAFTQSFMEENLFCDFPGYAEC